MVYYQFIVFYSILVQIMFLLCGCAESDNEGGLVKVFSRDEFSMQLQKRNNFIMFFAPWCSHCKRFTPVWEELADKFNSNENSNLAIAKVDCTIHTELCSNQDITGYPTLKLYKMGETEGKKFKGTRDIPALKQFITDEINNIDVATSENDVDQDALIEITDDTVEKLLSGIYFVKFFAPWCSHCQTLAPVWHKLAVALEDLSEITVAKVDCTKNKKVCNTFDVMSYPTLLWIKDGKKIDVYQDTRSLESLLQYANKMLSPTDSSKTTDSGPEDSLDDEKSAIVLNDENFQIHIDNGFTFVKFFAPWCGHCKRLAPTWEELAQKLSSDGKIKIATVDCTLEENKELCNDQEVEGYPTLIFYQNGVKVSEYNGSRALEDLIEFVKRHISHDEL